MYIYYQDYPMTGKVFQNGQEIKTAEEIEGLELIEGIETYALFDPRFSFHITTYVSPLEHVVLEADGRKFEVGVSFAKDTKKAFFKSRPKEI